MKQKKKNMDLYHAEEVLKLVLYSLNGPDDRTIHIPDGYPEFEKSKIRAAVSVFRKELQELFGSRFPSRLKKIRKNCPDVQFPGVNLFAVAAGMEELTEEIIVLLENNEDYSVEFLYAFNIFHNIIPEIIGYSSITPGQAAEYEYELTSHTKKPEKFSLLAAATESDAVEKGYILKDVRFQSYSFSVFKEDKSKYAFDFISRHDSLRNKLIHITICNPETMVIEEICNIDTRQYTLYFHGDLSSTAEIKPAVVDMGM